MTEKRLKQIAAGYIDSSDEAREMAREILALREALRAIIALPAHPMRKKCVGIAQRALPSPPEVQP